MRTLSESFSLLMLGLKAVIAEVAAPDRSRTAFLVVVWGRLSHMVVRFAKLYARWKAGTLPKARGPRPPRAPREEDNEKPRAKPPFHLPGGRMWLVRHVQKSAAFASQLRHLLATDPEIPAFLEACPQAGRILRPLCQALGVNLPAPYGVTIDHLVPIAAKPRAPKPRAPSPRRPRPSRSKPSARKLRPAHPAARLPVHRDNPFLPQSKRKKSA
jgi:hypothetical protein